MSLGRVEAIISFRFFLSPVRISKLLSRKSRREYNHGLYSTRVWKWHGHRTVRCGGSTLDPIGRHHLDREDLESNLRSVTRPQSVSVSECYQNGGCHCGYWWVWISNILLSENAGLVDSLEEFETKATFVSKLKADKGFGAIGKVSICRLHW